MFAALAASLLFTFTYATWAAKSRRAGMILIPILDILQSVPILGFLSFTVVFFMNLFPGRVLGAELASIFAIFTSQAWNMAFSFYSRSPRSRAISTRRRAGFGSAPGQRFWRLEVPFGMPGLIWNMMMSMSGGLVLRGGVPKRSRSAHHMEAARASAPMSPRRSRGATSARSAGRSSTMAVVILLYDQLLFRPLVAWSAKFRFETTAAATANHDPWLLKLVRRTHLLRVAGELAGGMATGSAGHGCALCRRASRGGQRRCPRVLGCLVTRFGWCWLRS